MRKAGFYEVKTSIGNKTVYWDGKHWNIDFGIAIIEIYGNNNHTNP